MVGCNSHLLYTKRLLFYVVFGKVQALKRRPNNHSLLEWFLRPKTFYL